MQRSLNERRVSEHLTNQPQANSTARKSQVKGNARNKWQWTLSDGVEDNSGLSTRMLGTLGAQADPWEARPVLPPLLWSSSAGTNQKARHVLGPEQDPWEPGDLWKESSCLHHHRAQVRGTDMEPRQE